ncbi:MAG: DUF3991 and toprim domain-containing protein [Oscillospiraceae bacterium]|jgi:hypothetical protein|nr:DUF3991 and toprim domain-containing protein [Oscillospiraceae bacterium]
MSVYTEKQIAEVRQTDMVGFLERLEGFTFKRVGSGWRCIEHDSLVVMSDRCGWFWNSKGVGGANAFDFCQKIYGMSFPAAMATITGVGETVTIERPLFKKEEKSFALPQKATGKFNRVFAYLNQSRCIDKGIISQLMHDNKIYQDDKNNAVFVGFDKAHVAKYASVRGTLTDKTFRGDCQGSDKRFSFSTTGSVSQKVYVFESPIDLLSHATLANLVTENSEAWKKHNRLSLAGTSDGALNQYLKDNPDIKEIIFCLDNDPTGRRKTSEYMKKYEDKGFICRNKPSKNKDFNDDLKAYIGNNDYSLSNKSNKKAMLIQH